MSCQFSALPFCFKLLSVGYKVIMVGKYKKRGDTPLWSFKHFRKDTDKIGLSRDANKCCYLSLNHYGICTPKAQNSTLRAGVWLLILISNYAAQIQFTDKQFAKNRSTDLGGSVLFQTEPDAFARLRVKAGYNVCTVSVAGDVQTQRGFKRLCLSFVQPLLHCY